MQHPVMIFAAGFGTRMKHLTQDRPKPLVEVAGVPLIDHTLALAEALPAETIVVNMHYKHGMLSHHLAGKPVQPVLEWPRILDTGGGLRNALPLLGHAPVMTLNSDAIWSGPNPLTHLAKAWDPTRMDGLLCCISPKRAVDYEGPGNFVPDATGRVIRGDGLIYGGAQIIKTEKLRQIEAESFSLNVLWDMLITENSLYAVEYVGFWCDVGHPAGITTAERLLSNADV